MKKNRIFEISMLSGCQNSRAGSAGQNASANHRIWIGLLLLLVLVLPSPAAAQSKSPDWNHIDAYVEKTRADWEVPGLAVAVVHQGKVVHMQGYGARQLGKPEKVDADTLFAIASNSKAFTAACLAVLVEQGKLKWDTKVTDVLPGFQMYDPWVTADMRINDLLSHRSGLRTFSGDLLWYGTPYDRRELIRRMRYLKPTFPFRAGYGYSNLMFVAAGEVVASVSGQAWEQFIRDNILDPLQMRRTVLTVRNLDAKGNAAQPHATIKGKMESLSWVNWDAMGPAGGIISCVADMARWLQLQLGRGTLEGRKIFAARLSQDMWTPHNTQRAPLPAEGRADRHFRAYGLGWSLSDYKGRLVVEHGGSYDGMTSQTWMMPEEQLGMVVLTNSDRGISGSITSYIRDAFLGEPEKDWGTENLSGYKKRQAEAQARREKEAASRVTGTRPSLPLEGYAGTYGGPMYGNATVTLENGGLVLRLLPNPDLVADLTHWHYDTFELTWRKKFAYFGKGKVLFVFNNLGKVIEMKLDVPNEDFWFDELELLKQK